LGDGELRELRELRKLRERKRQGRHSQFLIPNLLLLKLKMKSDDRIL